MQQLLYHWATFLEPILLILSSFYLFIFGPYLVAVLGTYSCSVVRITSWQVLGYHLGCWISNPYQQHERQVPCPLYYKPQDCSHLEFSNNYDQLMMTMFNHLIVIPSINTGIYFRSLSFQAEILYIYICQPNCQMIGMSTISIFISTQSCILSSDFCPCHLLSNNDCSKITLPIYYANCSLMRWGLRLEDLST